MSGQWVEVRADAGLALNVMARVALARLPLLCLRAIGPCRPSLTLDPDRDCLTVAACALRIAGTIRVAASR